MRTAGPHPAWLSDEVLLAECMLFRYKDSGPGGQRRNKVETAVRLTHDASGCSACASEDRSAEVNRKRALHRLRFEMALHCRSADPEDRQTLWQPFLHKERIRVSADQPKLAGLLADLLNIIELHDGEIRPAADAIGASASQVIKCLSLYPPALTLVNQWRSKSCLHALKHKK